MENKILTVFIYMFFISGCKNIAFLNDKNKYNAKQAAELENLADGNKKYTEVELNLASEYLSALSIYLTEKKINKQIVSKIIDCDPDFDQISPWSMHIKSYLDSQSMNSIPAETTDCQDSAEKLKFCTKKFTIFCNSPLHAELLSTFK